MTEPTPARSGTSDDDQINLGDLLQQAADFVRRCISRRAFFAKVWIASVLIGALYIAGRTPTYVASTRILPYKHNESGGAVSGLASIAGINLPISAPGQVVTADLYPEVANSRSFRARLAKAPLQFRQGSLTYEAYFDSVYSPRFIEASWLFLRRVKSALTSGLSGSGAPTATVAPDSGLVSYSDAFLRQLEDMKDRVRTDMDRKTNIITITVSMPDALAAAGLAKLTAAELTKEIITYESRKATEVASSLKEQQALAESRYMRAQQAVTEFRERNRTMGLRSEAELQKLEVEYTIATELYKNVSTQLTSAVVKQQENTPVLTVLEPSVVPNRASYPQKSVTLIVLLLLSTLFAAAKIAVEPFLKRTPRSA